MFSWVSANILVWLMSQSILAIPCLPNLIFLKLKISVSPISLIWHHFEAQDLFEYVCIFLELRFKWRHGLITGEYDKYISCPRYPLLLAQSASSSMEWLSLYWVILKKSFSHIFLLKHKSSFWFLCRKHFEHMNKCLLNYSVFDCFSPWNVNWNLEQLLSHWASVFLSIEKELDPVSF